MRQARYDIAAVWNSSQEEFMKMVTYGLAAALVVGSFALFGNVLAQGQSAADSNRDASANRSSEKVATDRSAASQQQSGGQAANTAQMTPQGPRQAVERFIQHVNAARVALAMKDQAQASEHLRQARQQANILKNASADQRQVSRVESGRVIYQDQPNTRNYYFPVETGPVSMQKVETGPFWAKNKGAAVTDAEIVYLSLDLSGDKAEQRLSEAMNEIERNEISSAQATLDGLIDEVIKEDEVTPLPHEKARANMALARSFIAQQNYEGARFALDHAKDALEEMDDNSRYADRRDRNIAMRQEVERMQSDIQRNDPTMLERADAQIREWWNDLQE
jgi:hypothetical protein